MNIVNDIILHRFNISINISDKRLGVPKSENDAKVSYH